MMTIILTDFLAPCLLRVVFQKPEAVPTCSEMLTLDDAKTSATTPVVIPTVPCSSELVQSLLEQKKRVVKLSIPSVPLPIRYLWRSLLLLRFEQKC